MNDSRICMLCKAEKLCGREVKAYSAECMNIMRLYIHERKKFNKMVKDMKEKAETGR